MPKQQKRPHKQHDHSYKKFFTHPEMVKDLLSGLVKPAWFNQLDHNSWEKVNGSFVTDDSRERSDDIIWKVRWGEQWIWIYIILEFQATIDYSMPVRINAYISLLWEDLILSKQISDKGPLPPILPIVLYNGKRRWNAAPDLQSMLQPGPPGMEKYRPQMSYLLIDEGAYSDNELKPLRNLVAALFRMENSNSAREIDEVLEALCKWLSAPEQSSLRRAFAVWVGRVIMRKLPGGAVEGVHDLLEMRTMLSERMDEWAENWKKEGIEKGRLEGLNEGRRQGEIDLLLRQLTKRFGIVPEWAISNLRQAELTQLETWAERLLEISSLEELFEIGPQPG